MIVTEVNPPWARPDDYIGLLNTGFRQGWNHRSFQWYQRREFNGQATDIAVRAERGRLLSIASYCYRQIIDPAGQILDVCVMGSATTVAGQRGQGHYSALLQTGIALCRERSCAAMIAFVTRSNGSSRGFTGLGAYTIPSYYITSDSRRPPSTQLWRPSLSRQTPIDDEIAIPVPEQTHHLRFHYAHRRDWLNQLVKRPNTVRALRIAHDSVALIERVGGTDRLQWLGCPLHRAVSSVARIAGASIAAGRNFFMFTMNGLQADAACRAGLTVREGWLLVMPIDRSRAALGSFAQDAWDIHSGDRM